MAQRLAEPKVAQPIEYSMNDLAVAELLQNRLSDELRAFDSTFAVVTFAVVTFEVAWFFVVQVVFSTVAPSG
ncbi:MAG TPA: hypothetical protein VM821_00215 [Abditibacteriaceae bacterium]|nr:hypothetical protein [Abditibacteriaceae bacterium]